MPAKFAMVITPASTPPAPRGEEDSGAAEMAARIASGPGFWTDWLAELDRRGLLEELLAEDVIAPGAAGGAPGHKYDRVLTAKMGHPATSATRADAGPTEASDVPIWLPSNWSINVGKLRPPPKP